MIDLLELLKREIDQSNSSDKQEAFTATESALTTIEQLKIKLSERRKELLDNLLYENDENEPWWNK